MSFLIYLLVGATQNNLKLYWNVEACANASNNFFNHGITSGGKYYSFLKPSAAGEYSMTLVNSGASASNYFITGYFAADGTTVPTNVNVNGYLGLYNSITLATTGTAAQLNMTATGTEIVLAC